MARAKPKPRRRSAPVYDERGFRLPLPDVVRRNPADSLALLTAAAGAAAIVMNAVILQGGTRPLLPQQPLQAMVMPAPRPELPLLADAAPSTAPAVAPAPAPPAAEESPNMLVLEVQAELSQRGLYDGPTDGLFGPRTEAAIFDFEIGAGLKPTGQPGPQLLAAMRTNTTPAVTPSPRVMAVQRVLDQRGYGPVKIDGVVGEATRAAVRRFEASRGLPQRGDLTPALLRELSEASGVAFH